MTELAAIDAQVVDIQNDRLHKGFIKVTLHVAAERGALLTDVLGWPTYTAPVPVALARLNPGLAAPSQDGDAPEQSTLAAQACAGASASRRGEPSDVGNLYAQASGHPQRTAPDKRLVQQASIKCTDPMFRLFLEKTFLPIGNKINAEQEARECVRLLCEVESISEIIIGTPAADKWDRLMGRFSAWERGMVA